MRLGPQCWCGNQKLAHFSPAYLYCSVCHSLVLAQMPEKDVTHVFDDESDLYSKYYYLNHLPQQYGYPDISTRSRADLPERCLYWLGKLLKYKLPPAKILELGSGHGGFVAMLDWTGFEASGLELSPWLVELARQTFQIRMLLGPVEDQAIEPGTLDVIALMDVLEHLPDPVATIHRCVEFLKPDGMLLIQTPGFREGTKTYEELLSENDPFVRVQLKELEHLFLFSPQSAKMLMERVGCSQVIFEPALFEYDMFFIASRVPLPPHNRDEITNALTASPSGRMVLALLELDDEKNRIQQKWQGAEADRAARLAIIHRMSEELTVIEADRTARLEQIHELTRLLKESEADRAARLDQIHELIRLLKESEADRAARIEVIHEQGRRLSEAEQATQALHTILQSPIYKLLHRLGYWKDTKQILANPSME